MYQIHCQCRGEGSLERFLADVDEGLAAKPGSKALFHLFNDTADRAVTDSALSVLASRMPDVPYLGCSTSGNISDGANVAGELPNLTVVCDVFEDPATRFEVHQFPLTQSTRESTAAALLALVEERPWVKAVEMLTTIIDVRMDDFTADLGKLRDDIVLFGGGALSTETVDMFSGLPYVFSSAGGNSGHAVAFVLYGGERFNVATEVVVGWKPLGRHLRVTRADGPVVYELEGRPAFELYHHYLSIENDDAFSQNSLLFPLAVERNGVTIIKAPVRAGEDGSLTLTSDLSDDQRECRIAYGDPATILDSIKESGRALRAFAPQAVFVFSCAARRMYWGPESVSRETLPFNELAPTAGFYTGGEFARIDGNVLHFNVTLVIVGLREGEADLSRMPDVKVSDSEFSRQMSIVNSLSSFVGVTSAELEAAYVQMEHIAKTDGLTGLANRGEIERRIEGAIASSDGAPLSIAMIDLDDFKLVNDAYGHKAGDDVLKGLGALVRSLVDEAGKGAGGRWGGEEFMIMLPGRDADEASVVAQSLCDSFAARDFPASGCHTMSVGVAQLLPGETADLLCSRVDKALYAAKKRGKNCVVLA